MALRIAYMTGEYLRISPFVFMYREIAELRKLGAHVETFSVRATDPSEDVSAEQTEERKETYTLLPCSPLRALTTHARLLARAPACYLSALRLAVAMRNPGLDSFFKQLAYFAEAGLVAARMRERDLTHLHNHFASSSCTVAMLAALLGGFTYSYTIHGTEIRVAPKQWRVDEKTRRAAFVVCISQFCRSQMMLHVPAELCLKLRVVHCGVTPGEYAPVRHEGHGNRLLFVGRLVAAKGLAILFDAMYRLRERLPDLTLTVIGDGPDRPGFESQTQTCGLEDKVQFVGYKSPEAIKGHLAQADIFVLPSFAEGVPVVLMEAMASGLPVIATRIAGVPELVEDGVSGFLIPPGDPETLAGRIETLIHDAALRNRMGAAGRAKVETDFNAANEARTLLGLFEETLS